MKKVRKIAYYISAHGYGHGVRSCDILRAVAVHHPDIDVIVVTDLPEEFLRSRLPAKAPVRLRKAAFDVGMVQLDSIRVDVPATLDQILELYAFREAIVGGEAEFIRQQRVDLVVADIPALPLEAAAEAGVPRVAVGNFGWDWIYEEFAAQDERWSFIAQQIAEGYAKADLLYRLPFAEPMASFARRRDVPLLASPGRERRKELAALTGAAGDRKWALLSFTSLDWDDAALDRVERLVDWEFFTVLPLGWKRRNVHPIDRARCPYTDVIASVDVVVTKPGYGVLSEAVVNGKPVVYSDRSDFREYHVLVDSIRRYLRGVHLPSADLYRGDLSAALEAMVGAPPPREALAAGGDVIIADDLAARVQR
jgi:L-arabinokinase